MAFYRSGFIAADERAKAIQKYIDGAQNPQLSDRERYNYILNGCSELHDILMSSEEERKKETDYYSRLAKINKKIRSGEEKGEFFSIRTKAGIILKLQQEYITAAGIFGRPPVKSGGEEENTEEVLKALKIEDGEIPQNTLEL